MDSRWKIFSLAIFGAGILFLSPPPGRAVEPEILLGWYPATLRNHRTQGLILTGRLWFPPKKEKPFTLLYPRPLVWGVEIRTGWLYLPETGGEKAILGLLKYEGEITVNCSIYGFIGSGGSYSSTRYANSTHANFITRGGLGFLFHPWLFQIAYEHRSNAHLSAHNRGVDLVTGALGYRFNLSKPARQ